MSIRDTVSHLLTLQRQDTGWRPGKARFAPPTQANYLRQISFDSPDQQEYGTVNLYSFNGLKDQTLGTLARAPCSYWLAQTLHLMTFKIDVLSNNNPDLGPPTRNHVYRAALSQRLKRSIELLLPVLWSPPTFTA